MPTGTGAGAAGRRFVAEHLAGWHVSPGAIDTAVLLCSELVGNATAHGTAPVRLEMTMREHCVRIEVSDASSQAPAPGRPGPSTIGGRGLWLVEALATQWGWHPERDGKTVWCTVADSPDS